MQRTNEHDQRGEEGARLRDHRGGVCVRANFFLRKNLPHTHQLLTSLLWDFWHQRHLFLVFFFYIRQKRGGWTTLQQQSILIKKGGWYTKGLSSAIKMGGGSRPTTTRKLQEKRVDCMVWGLLSRSPLHIIPLSKKKNSTPPTVVGQWRVLLGPLKLRDQMEVRTISSGQPRSWCYGHGNEKEKR